MHRFMITLVQYDEQEGKQRAIKRCHYGRVKGGVPSIALKELQILSTLSFSPHVVTLYDTFIHKGRLHMVLDYAPCTLQEVLDSGKHLTFEFIKIVFRQILYALKDCHENGVLHRVSDSDYCFKSGLFTSRFYFLSILRI